MKRQDMIYKGRLISLETIEEDGHLYERVIHPLAITVVPVDTSGKITLVRQWRWGAKKNLLELPAGGLEEGEDPAKGAERELQEEIGMKPGKLTLLTQFYSSPGFSTERISLYLAEDLKKSPLQGEDTDEIEIVKLPLNSCIQKIKEGAIIDAKTIAGILYYKEFMR